jgi:hypothetical protein
LQQAQGAPERPGGLLQSTEPEGQDTESAELPVWFLPSGPARGERNAHRVRGWQIAVVASAVLWVAGGVAGWVLLRVL